MILVFFFISFLSSSLAYDDDAGMVRDCLYKIKWSLYDLNPLKSSEAISWQDPSHNNLTTIYDSTFCNSLRILRPHCPVSDAVAALRSTSTCEYYGRV